MSKKKRKRKVELPVDRNGEPTHVGDVLMWDGGGIVRVESLTYYGGAFDELGYRWVANEEGTSDGESSDNLAGGEIVWRGGAG